MQKKIEKILEGISKEIVPYTGEHMLIDGIIDSFELFELVTNLEDEFDIDIDVGYIVEEYFGNASKIIALIEKLLNE